MRLLKMEDGKIIYDVEVTKEVIRDLELVNEELMEKILKKDEDSAKV